MKKNQKLISSGIAFVITITIFLLYSYINNPEVFVNDVFYRYQSPQHTIIYVIFQLAFAYGIYLIVNYLQSIKHRQYAALDIIPQAIVIYSLTGKIIFVNKFACEKYDIEQEETPGLNILDFLVERDRPRALQSMKEHVTGKYTGLGADLGIVINDYITLTKTGKELQSTIYAGKFAPTTLIAVLIDNTEIENVKQVYTEQVELFWKLLNNLTVPLSYNDKNGDFKFVNRAFQDMMGAAEQDLLSKNLKSVLQPKDYDNINKRCQYVLKTGETIDYETLVNINNKQMAVYINVIPYKISGNILGTFQTTVDITKYKKKDALLKKEIQLTKALNKISNIMFTTSEDNLTKNIQEVLGIIRQSIGVCRVYVIIDKDSDISILGEDIEPDLKPYTGIVFNMSRNHKKFYKVFMSKKATLKAKNVTLSKYAGLEHFKIFNMKSVVETAIPGKTVDEDNIVIGACTVKKYKDFSSTELEFLSAAGRSIVGAIYRVDRINNLKLSEETLSTLIDNTDIGIVIANNTGRVFYTNDQFEKMFGPLKESKHIFVMIQYVAKDNYEKALSLYKDREYKGYSSGTIKVINRYGHEIYVKIYSARIDYEASKAYLTTIVDVTEYMVEDI